MIQPTSTLREIALANPATIRVFERHHLDYCCGGRRPLAEVCAEQSLDQTSLLDELNNVGREKPRFDAEQATLTELIGYILTTHHAWVRAELPRLQQMAAKVTAKHGPQHPELLQMLPMVQKLASEMLDHMAKEEQVLFPYVQGLELAQQGQSELPHACFPTVAYPIRAMEFEHEAAGALMEQFRALTRGYTLPADACPTLAGLYAGLEDYEHDLHRHAHLENSLLFPRALELESKTAVIQ
ncbi:iron-sulfur cluster repair di-iron protein [Telmatobacter bradus]|uniref:iron-sulfur cluster repair di-iron protein n=1 Tax=Telmatobacter bradus TaxID=474953 RepID=UPI003B43BA8E